MITWCTLSLDVERLDLATFDLDSDLERLHLESLDLDESGPGIQECNSNYNPKNNAKPNWIA